jgi:hypothetical protein
LQAKVLRYSQTTTFGSGTAYRVYTPSYETLHRFRNRWYPNGVKVVPRDIAPLQPEAALWWYIGDGTNAENTVPASRYILFATHGFVREDSEFLAQLLIERGFHAKVHEVHKKWNGAPRKYYSLSLSARDVNPFLDWAGKCPIEFFEYKWKRPAARTWDVLRLARYREYAMLKALGSSKRLADVKVR